MKLFNIDCVEIMQEMVAKNERVEAIITDPPYLYLNHKLDRNFNEELFFELCSKITDKIVFFGRGDSFYRWNCICQELGFEFKEELIWDKNKLSSPVQKVSRIHETISVRVKKGNSINKVHINNVRDKIEADKIINMIYDIKRFFSSLNNKDIRNKIIRYIEFGEKFLSKETKNKFDITIKYRDRLKKSPEVYAIEKYTKGIVLQSIINVRKESNYKNQHPTQKPVELMRYLIRLVSQEGDTILDPFMGSGTTGVACDIEKRGFIGCDIEREYYDIALNRLGINQRIF